MHQQIVSLGEHVAQVSSRYRVRSGYIESRFQRGNDSAQYCLLARNVPTVNVPHRDRIDTDKRHLIGNFQRQRGPKPAPGAQAV